MAVPQPPAWNEVESEVHFPGRWLLFAIGGLFLVLGIAGFIAVNRIVAPGFPVWIGQLATGLFALLGAVPFAAALASWLRPTRIRHAAPDVLPEDPRDPVTREGSVVHGRLTHELAETSAGLEFRPASHLWRNDLRFLLGFGIPFLTFFAGLLTWVFHDRVDNWLVAALGAMAATLLCGGTAIVLIGLTLRSSYRRLGRLGIPADGGDLELNLPADPNDDRAVGLRRDDAREQSAVGPRHDDARKHGADLAGGLRWVFLGETQRQQLTIPRRLVAAVQLCPWRFNLEGSGSTWAVQGLLVLKPSAENVCHRLPLLLTSDFAGAARLMRRLAEELNVPYLFSADAAGWQAEDQRAKTRPPQKTGGSQS